MYRVSPVPCRSLCVSVQSYDVACYFNSFNYMSHLTSHLCVVDRSEIGIELVYATGERSVALSENGRSSLCITLKGMVINKQPPTETARGRL